MELNILEEKHNPMFGRKEITAQLESEISPNRLQVLDAISKKFTCPVENIKISMIRSSFGIRNFIIKASIYGSQAEKDAVELKKKKENAAPVKAAGAPAQQ